jgi:hypothetical protein
MVDAVEHAAAVSPIVHTNSLVGNESALTKLRSKQGAPSESEDEQDHPRERNVHRRARIKIREIPQKARSRSITISLNDLPHFY